MKRGRQIETNDSGIPGVFMGAANRWKTDYISFTLGLCLCHPLAVPPTSDSFDEMETLEEEKESFAGLFRLLERESVQSVTFSRNFVSLGTAST